MAAITAAIRSRSPQRDDKALAQLMSGSDGTLPRMEPPWADIAQTAILGGQLFVLAVAAVVAWRQVREARRLREQQIRPFVVVDFEVDRSLFFLAISNVGTTLAPRCPLRD